MRIRTLSDARRKRRAVQVAELFATLGLDIDQTGFGKGTKALNDFQKKFENFVKLASGAFAVKKITDSVGAYADQMDRLKDVSTAIGVSAETLQIVGFAAEQAGSDADSAATGLQKFVLALRDVGKEGSPTAAALKELGINASELDVKNGNVAALLPRIADGMVKITNPVKRAEVAFALFSKSGVGLIQMLQGGGAAFADARAELEAMGALYGSAEIEKAGEFGDTQAKLKHVLASLRNEFARELLPALVALMKGFMTFYKTVGKPIVQGLIKGFKFLGRAIQSLVVSIYTIGKALVKFALPLRLTIEVLKRFVDEVRKGSKLAIAALIPLGAAALYAGFQIASAFGIALAPILAIVAGVLVALVAFEDLSNWFTGDGGSLFEDWYNDARGWMRDKFGELIESVSAGFREKLKAVFDWFGAKIDWVIQKIEGARQAIAEKLGLGLKPGEVYENTQKQLEDERRFQARAEARKEVFARLRQNSGQASLPVPSNQTTNNGGASVVINVQSNASDPVAVAEHVKRAQNEALLSAARKIKR